MRSNAGNGSSRPGFTHLPELEQVPQAPAATNSSDALPAAVRELHENGSTVYVVVGPSHQSGGWEPAVPVSTRDTEVAPFSPGPSSTIVKPYLNRRRRQGPNILAGFRDRRVVASLAASIALVGAVKFTSAGADACDGIPLCASSFFASGESMPDTITSTAKLPDIKTGDMVRKLATYSIAPQGFLQWKGTDGKINPSSVTVDVSLKPDIAKLTAVGAKGVSNLTTLPQLLSFFGVKSVPEACVSDVQKIADTAIEHAPALASAGNIATIEDRELINPYKYAPFTNKALPNGDKGVKVYISYSFTGTSETVANQTGLTSPNAKHAVIDGANLAACLPKQ